jgi:septal ring factor EnvC (AmiA/AmiB activator)
LSKRFRGSLDIVHGLPQFFSGGRFVKQGKSLPDWMRRSSVAGMLLLLGSVSGWSQESSPAVASSQSDSTAAAIHELQQEVKELRSAMAEMRSETEQYRAENAALRREIARCSRPIGSHSAVAAELVSIGGAGRF